MIRILILLFLIPMVEIDDFSKPRLLLSEDFNTESLDLETWNYELGDGCPNICGWGNNERQVYTKKNISIRDQQLVITATKEGDNYYSGRISTKDKFEFKYGTVEVKAQLPRGNGLWPAIWMLGHDIDSNTWPACGEIDIMEQNGWNKTNLILWSMLENNLEKFTPHSTPQTVLVNR